MLPKGRIAAIAAMLVGATMLTGVSAVPAQVAPEPEPALPIVFVHGGAGSAAQYQSQAMRFASNDYPNVVTGIDRTSSSSTTLNPMLDEFFDDVMAQTGDAQIYAVGHSLGTGLMNNYLNSSPERAARVAKYISIDGAPANCGAITTECIDITAASMTQGHTQSVTSPESFATQYEFFTGAAPATTTIVPEDDVEISGRAILFPANTGPGAGTLAVWEVDGATGHRTATDPVAEFTFDESSDGSWGPLSVESGQHYEFALQRDDAAVQGHYYFEPFVRDNHLIRLLVSPPDSAILANTDASDDHSAVVAIRYKEWWGNHPTVPDDSLQIATTSASAGDQPSVELINAATAPTSNFTIGVHVFDEGTDQTTDTSAPIPFFFSQFFQTGVDVFMPAASPPDGTITLRSVPRDATNTVQEVNVANWASSQHRIVVEFNDFPPASDAPEPTERRPMVFVHGGAGSGAQFETQAMRFASNGYPADHVRVLEYNSANPAGFGAIPAQLDALVADIKADTGTDQIDLLGHSLGTGLMQSYLADPARAANVAHYVNIDGAGAPAPPGGVPTLAIWGEGNPTDEITGATNVHFDDQSHVEVATSRESFREMFRFFNDGEEPATLDVVAQPSAEIELAGRAVNFPANDGVQDATLDVYEVDAATGERLGGPVATFVLDGDGSWGPFGAEFGARYEFAISRDSSDRVHHLYLPPVIRSDYLVRLLSSPPGQGVDALIERGDDHSALVITRYKEWWGDHPTDRDVLMVDGTDVLNAATNPLSKNVIGVIAFDAGSDGATNLTAPIASLFGLPFITGVDHFVPATDPPSRTVSIVNAPRGDTSRMQVVNVPNFASSQDAVSVHFADHVQGDDGDGFVARYTDGQCSAIAKFAAGLGLDAPDDLVRLGVAAFRSAAEAGAVAPVPAPPANDGPCDLLVDWSEEDAAAIAAAAQEFGVSGDQLHNVAGWFVVRLVYAAIVGTG